MRRILNNIKNGIWNYWYWRKVIWNDRWWDYSFFNIIMKHKLKSMEGKWNKSYSVNADETKLIIEYGIELLDNIVRLENGIETKESVELLHKYYQKFGDLLYKTRTTEFFYEYEDGTHVQKVTGPNIELLWD